MPARAAPELGPLPAAAIDAPTRLRRTPLPLS